MTLPAANLKLKLHHETLTSSFADTRYGLICASVTDLGLRSIILGNDPSRLRQQLRLRYPGAHFQEDTEASSAAAEAVRRLVAEPVSDFDFPLDLQGTPFQVLVWQALMNIPYGTTTTYAGVAQSIGSPKAVRAVGAACGANHLAVVIPCHRVLSCSGKLTGYRWGLEWKQALLDHERTQRATSSLS